MICLHSSVKLFYLPAAIKKMERASDNQEGRRNKTYGLKNEPKGCSHGRYSSSKAKNFFTCPKAACCKEQQTHTSTDLANSSPFCLMPFTWSWKYPVDGIA